MEPIEQPEQSVIDAQNDTPDFPVVGIGGSAGALQAVQQFFASTPADSGAAFVVILHLSPEYESNLAEVLGQSTRMLVTQITKTVRVEQNHVYVISPNKELSMVDGHIELRDPEKPRGQRAPIDLFFRTLAEARGQNAAAVILSGTGADGSIGLGRVKEAGGIALVQDPAEAEYDAMPRHAIATGLVDMVLPVAALPARLIDCWQDDAALQLPGVDPSVDAGNENETLRAIFALMRARTGHDFSQYKKPTIMRRIGRRMAVRSVSHVSAYLEVLRSQPEEAPSLLRDLLISVTNFFRDSDVWAALERVIPTIFAGKGADDVTRVWVVGCATGEEAYSIAMVLYEFAEALPYRPNIQIFATDIDEDAIAHARQGLYLNTIANDVSPERLRRFFTQEQGHYRVQREIRDMVLFAVHNVLHDPPFSRLDLLTCRNVLIYLNRTVQEQLLQLFHFTLRADGYLMLGSSESTDGVPSLFAPIDKAQRLYQRRLVPAAGVSPIAAWSVTNTLVNRQQKSRNAETAAPSFNELDLYVLSRVGPPTIIVNEEYEIVHLARGAGQFLELADGEPTHNLLKVIQRDLRLDVRTALFTAVKQRTRVETRAILIEIDNERRSVQVSVQPLEEPQWARGYVAVVFQSAQASDGQTFAAVIDSEPHVRELEEELGRTKEQLRTTIEQYETVVEEYRAANEELQAINEEVRAASEELETSKEELQSVNEELTTVNQELKHKIEELSQSNNDLQNFMASTNIGTIFVDRDMRIKRYTPSVEAIFNLIPGDTNRPLAHVTHRLQYDRLPKDAAQVLQTLIPIERELHTIDDRWYLARIQPYRTTSDSINGVVLTFVDITERRVSQAALRAAEANQRAILDSSRQSIMLLAPDYTLQVFNRYAAEATLHVFNKHMQVGQSFLQYVPPQDRDDFIAHFQQAMIGQEITLEKRIAGPHSADWWEFFYSPIKQPSGEVSGITFTSRNITERKRTEANLAFLAEVSQDLVHLTNIDETMDALGAKIGQHLGLSACMFAELSEAAEIAVINYGWHRDDVPSLLGTYRMQEFVTPEILQLCRAGKAVVIQDVFDDSRTDGEQYAALNIGSFLSIPLVRDNEWRFLLVVYHSEPHNWTEDEIELMRELTARIWARLEAARAEAALRESEARMRTLVENLPGGAAFIVDRDLRYLLAEGEALSTADLTPNDLVGKTIYEALPKDLLATYEDVYRKALRGQAFEFEHTAHDLSFISRGTPLRSANGEVYAVMAVSYDITERKRAEEALRESQRFVEGIVTSLPLVVYIFDFKQRRNLYLSPQVTEVFGYTVKDLQASGENLLPSFFHPEDLPAVGAYFESMVQSQDDRVFSIECRMKHKHHGWVWVVCRDVVYQRDNNGMPTQLLGTAEDISERKGAEEALRANEERLRLVINSVQDYGIFTINPDGSFESWNVGAENLFGYSEAEVLGKHWSLILTAEDRAEGVAQREMEQALAGGATNIERWHLHKDGSTFFASGVLTAVAAGGQTRWFVKVLRNLTERKQAEQALEERVIQRTHELISINAMLQTEIEQRRVAEQQRQDLLRQVVAAQEEERQRISRELHDQLGQQLTALRLGLGALRSKATSHTLQIDMVERLQKLANEIDEDVDRLALELRPSVLDNLGLLQALQQHVDEWQSRSGIQAEFQSGGNVPARLAPEAEIVLYRAVQEALNNVLKHAKAQHVSVILERRDSQIQVIVEDDGQGFDLETVKQSSDARRKLGLLGMQERLALVGGTVTIESEPGIGTTIYFRVPLG